MNGTCESFVLSRQYGVQIKKLSNEQAGILLKAIMSYQAGEELPQMDDVTDMVFSIIQRDKVDLPSEWLEWLDSQNFDNGTYKTVFMAVLQYGHIMNKIEAEKKSKRKLTANGWK